ncbi:MAG: aminotransferase class V-fold PLP-dependent enzyme, partial [Clostridium paraputrificum]
LVPHIRVDMSGKEKDESIDFLVFSGHKLYAPFGSGVIVGLKDEFEEKVPDNEGGGTVNIVLDNSIEYLSPPEKDEAGSPNYFGVVAITKALEELDKIGFDNIKNHEIQLRDKLICGLCSIPRVKTYGDIVNREDRLGIGVFNIDSIYHQKVAEKLAKHYGISVRQGWFCAHPYCRRLMNISEKDTLMLMNNKGMPGMIRASFGIYNDISEVDYFLNAVEDISMKK